MQENNIFDKNETLEEENKLPLEPDTTNFTENEEINEEPSVSDNQSQVVYRTRTGKKYHRAGCSYLKSIIETTVSEAQAMGLGPCSRCNPPR